MVLDAFGPFAAVFPQGELDVPGYLELLHLAEPSAQIVLDRIEVALAAGDPRSSLDALFDDPNWRPHLVGAVALVLDGGRHLSTASLWRAVDAGSWVTPQLIVSAYFVDPAFPAHCRLRVERGAPIAVPVGSSPAERHSATGPSGTTRRSAKLMASLVAVGLRVRVLAPWLETHRATAAVADLVALDEDGSADIADRWHDALVRQLAQRGRALVPVAE